MMSQVLEQITTLTQNPIIYVFGVISLIAVPFIFLGIYYYYSKHPEKRFLE